MVGRIIRPCVVEEGGLTECIDHRLWCSAVHGSGAASESVRAPGLVCSGLVCSALARPADRQSLLQGVNSCKSRSHRAVVLHQPPAARGKSLDLGVSHSAVVHIACTKTRPFLEISGEKENSPRQARDKGHMNHQLEPGRLRGFVPQPPGPEMKLSLTPAVDEK
jgi:hypothetical protein